MKKIISLVLVLMMIFSMGINSFALEESVPEAAGVKRKAVINVIEIHDELYGHEGGKYYVCLDNKPYQDIKISSYGIISAKYVQFDPEIMDVRGMDILYGVVKGDGEPFALDYDYERTKAYADELNERDETTIYKAVVLSNVNILEITIADNYGVAYTEGILKIEATVDGLYVSKTLRVINDVTVFEYERVKEAAEGFDSWGYLICGEMGYSSYEVYMNGYNPLDPESYIPEEMRIYEDAAVVTTTAFRAVGGKNLRIVCDNIEVELYDIKAGQKGVNFKHYENIRYDDYNYNGLYDWGEAEAIEFGFFGNQTILGNYCVEYFTGFTWGTLREAFGIFTEDDIVEYYILKNGVVVKSFRVDYSLVDADMAVILNLKGSNSPLGQYEIVLSVPAGCEIKFEKGEGMEAEIYYAGSGSDFIIPENIPTRKWHTFLGWATSEDAAEAEYQPGDIYSVKNNVTFYPVWQENEEPKATISVSSGVILAGERATVRVELSDAADTQLMQFALRYDAQILDVVSCSSAMLPDATINYSEDGMIYFAWEDLESLAAGGTILEIEFEAAEDIEPQETNVEIIEDKDVFELIFGDSNSKEFRVATENGVISVVEAVFGDVDGNGKINVLDANIIRRYSAKLRDLTKTQFIAADVDGNGNVNVLDANLIRRYAARLIDKFPVEG